MSPAEFADKLAVRAAAAGFVFPAGLVEPLLNYFQLLTLWNRKINLTAANLDELPPEAVDRLFIEPVAAARFVARGSRIIDIGSGGGSPAIPFTLAAQGRFLVMVESRTRKSVFLKEAARVVALPAKVITGRYEQAVERSELHRGFDLVTIRAVRVDEPSVQRLARFISPGGALVLFQTSALSLTGPGMRSETHQLTANSVLQVVTLGESVPRGT